MTAPTLISVDGLLDAASQETGLSDYGDRSFVEPLTSYLRSVSTEGGLGPLGHEVLRMDTIRLLANRLRLYADLCAHPEIRDEDVSDPIVITGLPRTGTTKLHRAIAADPGVQSLPFWLAMSPGRINGAAGERDPRVAVGEQHAAALMQLGPDFLAAHMMSTHEAEEEVLLLQLTFDRAAAFTWYYDAPTYFTDMEGRSQVGPYGYLREVLQGLQWQAGGRRDRPWILKSPVHLGNLDALLAAFPNATVVHCHRNIDLALPSLCRLVETIRPARGVEVVDPAGIGRFFTVLQSSAWERNLQQRSAVPAARILDLTYDQIERDLGASIRLVYETHGRQLPAGADEVFNTWEQEHPAPTPGAHAYDLETYALTKGGLATAFSSYLDRFPDMRPNGV